MNKPRGTTWSHKIVFVLTDAAIIYLAFVAGLKIRLGEWAFLPNETGIGPTIAITIVTYLMMLWFSGVYRSRAETMHLDEFLKAGAALFVGWTITLTVVYLVRPAHIPGRSIMAAQAAFSVVGILGVRALLRYVVESRRALASHVDDDETAEGMRFDELLHRKPIVIHSADLRDYLAGRTVLVTGAGGSIGSNLCERLLELNPFRLVMVDVSEYNLFQLENALRARSFEGELEFRIADVRDGAIMQTMFTAFHPDMVFHAAAYKHVPLMERHPVEAFTNNTLSTVSLIRLCESYEAEQFIFVSTDKAVDPTSVLGATKRLSEWYVRAVNGDMSCKTVRFGNVLGSHGSVVPFFTEQIKGGGPITITHPDMRRYFMTADEACSLILQTMLLNSAPVYTLMMGEPVNISDLARFMTDQLSPPNESVEIEYTGIRPGEKINEALWALHEEPVSTGHPDIIGLRSQAPFSRSELDNYFGFLEQLCADNRTAELRKALFQTKLPAVPQRVTHGEKFFR